ncbi:MAG TPA: hypothetical protein VG942_05620 [Hyphomonadaceae bacterium]|nr:hypothetical protein [Hyphomonadaceae bacterium]
MPKLTINEARIEAMFILFRLFLKSLPGKQQRTLLSKAILKADEIDLDEVHEEIEELFEV